MNTQQNLVYCQHEYPGIPLCWTLMAWSPCHLSGLTFCGWRRDVAGENAIFFSTLETWGSNFVRRCQNCCKTEKLQSPIVSTFPLLSTLPSDSCALSELMESTFFAIWVEPTAWHAAPKHRSVPFVAGENQTLLLIYQYPLGYWLETYIFSQFMSPFLTGWLINRRFPLFNNQ